MDLKLLVFRNNKVYDISDIVYNLNWSDNVETLGMQFIFSKIVSKENRYLAKLELYAGDIVVLKKGDYEIFKGIIVNKNINGLYEESFTAFDFLFYLNKSKVIKQFNNETVSNCIISLCNDFNIKIKKVPNLATKVTAIYYDKEVSQIINELLLKVKNETKEIYYLEYLDGLNVFKRGEILITPTFKPSKNIAEFNVLNEIGADFSRTFNIEQMKNSIVIVNENGGIVRTLAKAKDEGGIEKYGLLQEIESVDEVDLNVAKNIAFNKLKELNKITETFTITLIGNVLLRAGRIIYIDNSILEVKGRYEILSTNHSVNNSVHFTTLELGALQ